MKSKTHKTLALIAMLFSLVFVVTNVSAQSQSAPYRLIDLGTLPGDVQSVAFDINNPGRSWAAAGGGTPAARPASATPCSGRTAPHNRSPPRCLDG